MAAINVFLDSRRPVAGGLYPIKFSIYHNGKQRNIPTGIAIALNQWKDGKIVSHPQRVVWNNLIMRRLTEFNDALVKVSARRVVRLLSCEELKNELIKELDPLSASAINTAPEFLPALTEFANMANTKRTHDIYQETGRSISRYLSETGAAQPLTFPQITRKWLTEYDRWLQDHGNKTNARGIHMRNIRAVFNFAIKEDLVSLEIYPFKKFQIKTEATAKRSLTVDAIRRLFAYESSNRYDRLALDVFKLTFYLIGINIKDLYELKAADYVNGRISYVRSKTGRLYDIKVLPQAADIIDKYRSDNGASLLYFRTRHASVKQTYEDYSSLCHVVNDHLHIIAESLGLPRLTTYWARHSWATIAAELEIPKETIAAALGHGGDSVTDVYINFNLKKVDEANLRVADAVKPAQAYSMTLEEELALMSTKDEECPF